LVFITNSTEAPLFFRAMSDICSNMAADGVWVIGWRLRPFDLLCMFNSGGYQSFTPARERFHPKNKFSGLLHWHGQPSENAPGKTAVSAAPNGSARRSASRFNSAQHKNVPWNPLARVTCVAPPPELLLPASANRRQAGVCCMESHTLVSGQI
jgi:hypothetical protein